MPNHKPIATRAPALFLLPGLLLGLWFAQSHGGSTVVLLGLALVAIAMSLFLNLKSKGQVTWVIPFLIGTTLAFWAYGTIRFPVQPSSETLALPAREARLIVDIKRVYGPMTVYRNMSGVAKVREATHLSPIQKNSQIYLRVKIPEASDLELHRGQRLQLTGVLYPIEAGVREDSFEGYLKSIGINYTFERTTELKVLKTASRFDRFCTHMNMRFDAYLRLGAPADKRITNIYVAMLLGKKAALSDKQSERFRMTGTMHFFAISGLHIGVIATVIAQCLLVLRVPRRYSPWIGLPLLYAYVEITGASPSAIRAFLMALCFWISFAIIRQRSPLGALTASAIAVLIIAPEQLWSLGFQLSYTVVLSILLFGLPLYQRALENHLPFQWLPEESQSTWQRTVVWCYDKCLMLFCISLSAWLGSSLLSAGWFGFIAPAAIILNMLLVNLAALVIIGGVIGLSTASMGVEFAAAFINHSAWVCLWLMEAFVQMSLAIPATVIVCEAFPRTLSYLGTMGYISSLFWLHLDRERFATKAIWLAPGFICLFLLLGILVSR